MEFENPEPADAVPDPSGAPALRPVPHVDHWDDWVEFDTTDWPRKTETHYAIVPTACSQCPSACGLLAYVDSEDGTIRRVAGNPFAPGGRGQPCAPASAVLSRVRDPERILFPLKRVGRRGEGKWKRVDWNAALQEIGAKIRGLILEGKNSEIVCPGSRPGHHGILERTLLAWGAGRPVSSESVERPRPDVEHSAFVLLVGAHLEAEPFGPQPGPIVEARLRGTRLAVIDPHLSNTANMADFWLPALPGTESIVVLALARTLLEEGLFDSKFLRSATDWQDFAESGREYSDFEDFLRDLKDRSSLCTPQSAERASGIPASRIVTVARAIGCAGSAFSSFPGANTCLGPEGHRLAQALELLHVLTGSIGTPGGNAPIPKNRFRPAVFSEPATDKQTAPAPMAGHISHLLRGSQTRIGIYLSRNENPVGSAPGAATWLEALLDEEKLGLHAAVTSEWSETAWLADYVLPVGLALENHALHIWQGPDAAHLSFSQPVQRAAAGRGGETFPFDSPGDGVPEEDELWIQLSWCSDPDGSLGVRQHFESPHRPGSRLGVEEYYRWIFENGVPGLPEAAASKGISPLAYMRKYGGFALRWNAGPSDQFLQKHCFFANFRAGDDSCAVRERPSDGFLFIQTFGVAQSPCVPGGNSKWLAEIAHTNPLWIHTRDAARIGVRTGDLIRVSAALGHFVTRAWVTEGIVPGVVGCSRNAGRWRTERNHGTCRWRSSVVEVGRPGPGRWNFRQVQGVRPFSSEDPDSSEIWWGDAGVPSLLAIRPGTGPVRVKVELAGPDDRYGDVVIDVNQPGMQEMSAPS
jgi:anaerobic selenocysteine-containing dehydrogenase